MVNSQHCNALDQSLMKWSEMFEKYATSMFPEPPRAVLHARALGLRGHCECSDGTQQMLLLFFTKRERKGVGKWRGKQLNSIFLLYSQPRATVSPNSHSKQYQALSVSVLFIEFSARVLLYICVHAERLLFLLPGFE